MKNHHAIPYSLARSPDVKLTFLHIKMDQFPKVTYKEWFGEQQPDNDAFQQGFLAAIESAKMSVEKGCTLIVFSNRSGDDISCHGVLYRSNLSIVPIVFESSETLCGWLVANAEGWGASAQTYKIYSSGMSCTLSSKEEVNFLKKPAVVIESLAPKLYKHDEIKEEKNEYFKKILSQSFKENPVDHEKLLQLWQQLKSTNKALDCAPGVADFEAFEQIAGYPFPAELCTIYRENNGLGNAIYGGDLLSFESIIEHWHSWKCIYDDWQLEELLCNESDNKKTLGLYTSPYWVPFLLIDGQSEYIGVDLAPGENGNPGQIIRFGRDISTICHKAENLEVFLEQVLANGNTGSWFE